MPLTISLSPSTEAKLRERASASGRPADEYAAQLIESAVNQPSLDELLAPVREQFARSGMSEEELSDLLEEVKHEARAERRKARRP